MAVEIHWIDFEEKYVVTNDARILTISDLFDEKGRATEESERAVLGIAGEPGAWLTFKLRPFERNALQ